MATAPRDSLGLRLVVRACAYCGHDGHVNSFRVPTRGTTPAGATPTHTNGAEAAAAAAVADVPGAAAQLS